MEEFEIGRRRPLRKHIDVKSSPVSTVSGLLSAKDIKDIESALRGKEPDPKKEKRKRNATGNPELNPHKLLPPIEIDLHIYELLDSTVGMDNYAMLQFQLDTVRNTMKKHCKRVGQKIIFIHGKGDGVLRKEVRSILAKEYASCDVQDASFLKYGFGATQVTVRQK